MRTTIVTILLLTALGAKAQKLTFSTPLKTTSLDFHYSIVPGSKKEIDTTYSVENNKPFRVIHTQAVVLGMDSTLTSFKVKYTWNEKYQGWQYYSVSIEPTKNNWAITGGQIFIPNNNQLWQLR